MTKTTSTPVASLVAERQLKHVASGALPTFDEKIGDRDLHSEIMGILLRDRRSRERASGR